MLLDFPANMLWSYLKLALRSLTKDKLRSSIEILGLAVGLGCALLMLMFVRQELSFDRFHARSDDIYRAWVKEEYGDGEEIFNSVTPLLLGQTLENNFPAIEATVRVTVVKDIVERGAISKTSEITLVDESFFEVFDFELLRGDPAAILSGANSVVLSESAATRFFGDQNPLGETLSIRFGDDFDEMRVVGLVVDPPANSSLQYDILVPFRKATALFPEHMFTSWFNVIAETYLLLEPGTDHRDLESKFPSMLKALLGDRYATSNYRVGLQPLTEIHLDPAVPAGLAEVSDPAYSIILAVIALLILFVACVNYMSLAVARSAQRMVEIGIRKSIGADRIAVVRQFYGEAYLTTAIALGLGIALAEVCRPLFGSLAGARLEPVLDATTITGILLLWLVVGLFAGSYPAFVLSGFRPVEILKGKVQISADRSLVRRGLVVAQFALSAFLITTTLYMGRQLEYIETKPLGFDKEQVVVIPTSVSPNLSKGLGRVIIEGMEITSLVKAELASNSRVIDVTAATHEFGDTWTNIGYPSEAGTKHSAFLNIVDEEYLASMGIEMAAGRRFSRENPSDRRRAVIVNESFVREYGLEDPVGNRLPGPRFADHEIIGVVRDFHFESLHGKIRPAILTLDPSIILSGISDISIESFPRPKLMVRISPEKPNRTLAEIEEAWLKVSPNDDFSFTFLDETINAQYRTERRLARIVRLASILAIVIACLGLFGLAGLAIVRRTKEIGIRKVMGASVPRLFWLLSRDFGVLLVVACLIAAPLAYLTLTDWLEQFAYRIAITPDLFVASGILTLGVALLAITYHGLTASLENPAECLRYE